MDYYDLLEKRIRFIMESCGSDAGERQNPGSKLTTQIGMIKESVWELNNLLHDTEDKDAALDFSRQLFYHEKPELAFGRNMKATIKSC